MKREVEIETQEAEEEMEVEEVVAPMEEVEEEPEEEDPEVEDIAEEPEPRRQLGKFMTPQVVRGSSVVSDHDRLGYSVEGPRRVRVVQPWKVRDIVIPEDSGVKREEFEPVFKKERISEEEKKVLSFYPKALLHSDKNDPGYSRQAKICPDNTRSHGYADTRVKKNVIRGTTISRSFRVANKGRLERRSPRGRYCCLVPTNEGDGGRHQEAKESC